MWWSDNLFQRVGECVCVGRDGGGGGSVSGGGSLKRFVKVLRLWDFVLSIKMALFERSEFDIFMIAFSKISES